MPETPPRKFRIPDDIWQRVLERAAEERTTATAIVVRALVRELKTK